MLAALASYPQTPTEPFPVIEHNNPVCEKQKIQFSVISSDFLHLEPSHGGYEYVLIVICHFPRFANISNQNKAGKTAADKTFNDFVPRFASELHCEQGIEFETELFRTIGQFSGCRTPPPAPLILFFQFIPKTRCANTAHKFGLLG